MKKWKDKEGGEKFSELIDQILAGKKVDLSKYPHDFREAVNFARRLKENEVKPSPSFKSQLKERLLLKLEPKESIKMEGFWERLRRVGKRSVWQAVAATLMLTFLAGVAVWGFGVFKPKEAVVKKEKFKVKKFASAQEFKDYLKQAETETEFLSKWFPTFGVREDLPLPAAPFTEKTAIPQRVSETTVQVKGIDEPDILKTDGKEIYFSASSVWGIEPPSFRMPLGEEFLPPQDEAKTNVIEAFPPKALNIDSKIDKSGELLLYKNILVVFSAKEITGYDVSNPKSPQEKWNIKLDEKTFTVATRLYQKKIYLVIQTAIEELKDEAKPCSFELLTRNGTPLNIKCEEIYHPTATVPVDVTFSVLALDPHSGETQGKVSFIGSFGSSVVYMSEKAVYVTYSYTENMREIFLSFLKEEAKDIVPGQLIERIEKLEDWERYLNSLSVKDREQVEKELSRRMTNYYRKHARDLERTGIVKIGVEGLGILATGKVSGYPLNQFALDEYNEYLRIATTVGERGSWVFGFGLLPERSSANDVYVLDKDLNIKGSVKDLGLTERIYAARFIGDKAYLVTFRETDPFYVLDLSDPQKPRLRGELKIPGYSSYLQPLTENKILGVGKEGDKVKTSLFDVSDPEKPKEIDKYILDEFWSDVLETHHAFLLDEKHQIFFLPGSKGGYVISYKNDKLELKKALEETSTRRAIFIDDYLYIIGDDKITVLDENNWEKVNELSL